MNKVKRNRVFRIFSSVRMAIPLMLILLVSVAYGTIVESRYNTDMARLLVYHTLWFQVLLCLLWINIFCATLSRIPFKKYHVGFIITHIGLLTLLIGSSVTNIWGVDGQLQVVEQSQNAEVVLPEVVLEIINRETGVKETFPLDRRLKEAGYEDFKSVNDVAVDRMSILSYLPFAKVEKSFKSSKESSQIQSAAVSFRMKSAFFDVNEWLNSKENPEFQLGPAHLALIMHTKGEEAAKPIKHRQPQSVSAGNTLEVLNKGGDVVETISLSTLAKNPVIVSSMKISLIKTYEQAVVAEKNKVIDGGQKGANPALELLITKQGKSLREITYAKYPTFSLNKDGVFGFTFRYKSSEVQASLEKIMAHQSNESMAKESTPEESQAPEAPGQPLAHGEKPSMPSDSVHAKFMNGQNPTSPSGNVIQFHIFEGTRDKVQLKLLKGGEEVLSQWVKPGETVQTPWMGMQLTVNELVLNGEESQEVRPTSLPLRTEMPPSAILVKPAGASVDEAFWLLEGQARDIMAHNHIYQIYYGRKSFKLPFSIFLTKFTKTDYPGTQTPMSFESLVKVNEEGNPINIHMNEPLTLSGYTLYQASYVMQPGEPISSIFSVNWDPGRWIKYVGSLILVFGIITFTLMRSRMVKANQGVKT